MGVVKQQFMFNKLCWTKAQWTLLAMSLSHHSVSNVVPYIYKTNQKHVKVLRNETIISCFVIATTWKRNDRVSVSEDIQRQHHPLQILSLSSTVSKLHRLFLFLKLRQELCRRDTSHCYNREKHKQFHYPKSFMHKDDSQLLSMTVICLLGQACHIESYDCFSQAFAINKANLQIKLLCCNQQNTRTSH